MLKTAPNAAGWQKLFDKLDISEKLQNTGSFKLTADQIRRIGQREPRLMTKFDSRNHRPKVLSQARVTILPITNGEYLLLRGDGYFDIPPTQHVETYDASKIGHIETLPWKEGIRSESQAIDTLFMASALKTFTCDDGLQLTMRGRLRSRRFTFGFRTEVRLEKLTVDGVQIEVDAGFEGKKIVIVEAKYGALQDFIVRQLFYPYRDLVESGTRKEIIPILLVYSNRVYSLYQFEVPDPNSYSVKLVQQVDYSLEEVRTMPRLEDVFLGKTGSVPSGIPFPQADDLSKVFDVTDLLSGGPARKEQIAEEFEVDPRQGDYYGNAAAFVGLTEKRHHQFSLTKDGEEFVKRDRTARIVEVARRVTQLPAFWDAAKAHLSGDPLDNNQIARLIERNYALSGSTPLRRASTVQAWVKWLSEHLR